MSEFLTNINEASLAIQLAMLFAVSVAYVVAPGLQRYRPEILIMSMVVVVGVVHQIVEITARSMFHDESLAFYYRIIWYFGFGLTDFMFVIVICTLAKLQSVKFSAMSLTLVTAYVFLGVLQISNYINDHMFSFAGSWLDVLYRSGIPAINSMVTAVLIFFTLRVYSDLANLHKKEFQ